MKLTLLVILFNLVFISLSHSQGRVSVGPEVGFPMDRKDDRQAIGLGGAMRYERLATKNLTFLLSAGYLHFSVHNPSGQPAGIDLTGSVTLVPVEGGVKYYVNEAFKGFYIGSDLGIVFRSSSSTVTSPANGSLTRSASENEFNFAPGFGYHFTLVDLTFKYNVISYDNYFSVRAAYVFRGK